MKNKLSKKDLMNRFHRESEETLIICNKLERIAKEKNNNILLAESKRIRLCADPNNFWYAKNLKCPDEEASFEIIGSYFKCESVFCAVCSRRKAYRNYRNATNALENVNKESTKETFYSVTLTVPRNTTNPNSIDSLRILKDAHRKFSINRSIKEMFVGGFKTLEPGNKNQTSLNLHFHYLITFGAS